MAILKVFKSSIPSVNYVTRQGSTIVFKEGRFETDHPDLISELEEQVAKRHPHIYVDPDDKEVDTALQEKLAAARAEAEAKVLADHEQSKQANNSGGAQSTQPQVAQTASPAALLKVTSSATLGGLTAPSNTK